MKLGDESSAVACPQLNESPPLRPVLREVPDYSHAASLPVGCSIGVFEEAEVVGYHLMPRLLGRASGASPATGSRQFPGQMAQP
jgi:hypothetical protein